jgi:hypothetical protein
MKKTFVLLSFFIFHGTNVSAYYEFDKKLEQAYLSILALNFAEAEKLLSQEKIEKPGNDLRLLYENYIDFLKAFISEEEKDFNKLKKNAEIRLTLLEKDNNNPKSPYHLYVQSEIHIQQALVRIKFEENFISATEIRKAYKLVVKNETQFSSFILNKKVLGFLHAIVGAVPSKFQWIVKMAGMEGTITQGLSELTEAYRKTESGDLKCYQTEILFYLGNIYSVFSMSADSVPLLNDMHSVLDKSPLIAYVYSNIKMKQGRNDDAISALNTALNSNVGYPFTFLYYKRGLAKLRKLELTSEKDFQHFLKGYKGTNNIKAAYQKLAWIALLKGDTAKYFIHLATCNEKGKLLLDEDKDAQFEAENKEVANVYLLKSRLLFDGGYYDKSHAEISGKTLDKFSRFRDQLEVTYRVGRIMQMTGQTTKAISYYEQTLQNGKSSKYHYAANSSLLLGMIYEDKKQYEKSKNYFQQCISMEYEQYKNSIDQKAQAGLERLKSKIKK